MMYKFLALLPAILSFTGFVIYLTTKRSKDSSSIVKSIVDTIKAKSSDIVDIDERLSPKQVYNLINSHTEFREKLSSGDYNLFTKIIKSEQKRNVTYGLITILLVCVSLFAFFKVEQFQSKLTFSDVRLSGKFDGQKMNLPTTKDNLIINWDFQGNDEDIRISLTSVNHNQTSDIFFCRAKDGQLTINNNNLEKIWGCPSMDDSFPVRITFQTSKNTYTFGPFEINTALSVLYHLDLNSNKVEVFTQTMNCGLLDSNYDFKIVSWSKDKLQIESLNIKVENGKGIGQFPTAFPIAKSTVKTIYFGKYSNDRVRIEEL